MAVLMAVLAWQVVRFAPFVIDDSYITFVYARNLASGSGPVFNPGEQVEGYSSFLWMLVVSFGFLLHLDPLWFAKGTGACLALATFWIAARLARRVSTVDSACLAVVPSSVLICINPSYVLWSTSGLETALYGFLLIAGSAAVVAQRSNVGITAASALWFAALGLTRIEGAAFGFLAFLCLWWRFGGTPCFTFRRQVTWLCQFGAPLVVWHAWRLSYYGWPLPNTYYAKLGGSTTWAGGLEYSARFAARYWGESLVPIALVVLVAGFLVGLRKGRLDSRHVFLAGVAAQVVALAVMSGGDWMPFYRFLVPALPILMVCTGVSLQCVSDAGPLRRVARARSAIVWGFVGLFFVSAIRANIRFQPLALQVGRTTTSWLRIGASLRERYRGDPLLASTSAGATVYESRFRLFDLVGLVDPAVAHLPVEPRRDGKFATLEHFVQRRPDLVMLVTYENPGSGCCRYFIPEMDALHDSAFFQQNYRLAESFPFEEIGGTRAWLVLFARRDISAS